MIVLDTNVVSELMRSAPAPQVREWVDLHPAGELWLTSMTVAELLGGVAVLPDGVRRRRLGSRIRVVLEDLFSERLLPFDGTAAVAYARVLADRRRAGSPIATADAVIAATCLAAGVSLLATRKLTDFAGTGLQLADPWTASTG